MLTSADRAVLDELRASTRAVLSEVIGEGVSVALLDAPNQRNVGDSMIWAGEVEYFRSLGLRVVHVADIESYRPDVVRRLLPDDGVVLIHGGGNFGDLWRGHQAHREQISRDLRDRRIVQLPQSIWFDEPRRAANANRIIGAHPDFTLLVRDTESQARAGEQLPDVTTRYCWDMALGWSPTPVASKPSSNRPRLLVLARGDLEGRSGLAGAGTAMEVEAAVGRPVEVADWTDAAFDSLAWRLARRIPRLARSHPSLLTDSLVGRAFRPLLTRSFTWINRANVRSGVQFYAGRSFVIVDRLHAHVLSVLLGIPHVMLDNSYRKLGAVYDEYTGRFSTAAYAHGVTEAVDAARVAGGEAR